MKELVALNGKWRLAYVRDKEYSKELKTAAEILAADYPVIDAVVPGCFELDFERAGIFPPLFYSANILELQKYEDLHLFYFRKFGCPDAEAELVFGGLDTYAGVYVNGEKVLTANNMLIPHTCEVRGLKKSANEIVVHIKPCVSEERKAEKFLFDISEPYLGVVNPHKPKEKCYFGIYNYASAYIRKAPYMFGWDIMPRAVSGGIWKPVYLREIKRRGIGSVFAFTKSLTGGKAVLGFKYETFGADGLILEIRGVCGNSRFARIVRVKGNRGKTEITVANPRLWWPRDYGNPDIYRVTCLLKDGEQTVGVYEFDMGIRTAELARTSLVEKDGSGEFCFIINGRRVFVRGTNWTPLDVFPARNSQRLQKAFGFLNGLNCNGVRCWGGNVYEDDKFFEMCDRAGIMVWQDFAMSCGVYPTDNRLAKQLRTEAASVVKRLRNHPSLIVWAGDNECDMWYNDVLKRSPDENILTRKVLANAVKRLDGTRPYMPSSPWIDEKAFKTGVSTSKGLPTPEGHPWYERRYFKSESFLNAPYIFASETGFFGVPSPNSLKKFISPERLWPWKDKKGFENFVFDENNKGYCYSVCRDKANDDWLVHSTCVETAFSDYSYQIPMTAKQARDLFGDEGDTLSRFAMKSQIAQAEGLKFAIEHYRADSRKTGVMWWSLFDGWPEISNGVVDYYFVKKLSYFYIKRSQSPFCVMLDEPESGEQKIVAVNDTGANETVSCMITDMVSGAEVFRGKADISAFGKAVIGKLPDCSGKFRFYLVKWKGRNVKGLNHFATKLLDIGLDAYISCMKRAGMFEFEGFDGESI